MSGVMLEAQVNLVSGVIEMTPFRSVSLSKSSHLEVIDVLWHNPLSAPFEIVFRIGFRARFRQWSLV